MKLRTLSKLAETRKELDSLKKGLHKTLDGVVFTCIPDLVVLYGDMAKTARATGWSELTIAKYYDDRETKRHIVVNGVLMTARKPINRY